MTFGKTTFGRSMSRTRTFLRTQLWVWPIVALAVLALIGLVINLQIRQTMEASLESELQTLLDIETTMVERWLKIQEGNAQSLANGQGVRKTAAELVAAVSGRAGAAPQNAAAADLSSLRAKMEELISPALSSQGFTGFVLVNKELQVVASTHPELIGQTVSQYENVLSKALEGEATASMPFASIVMTKDDAGRMRTGVPTMFTCAPVRDENLQVIGVLALRIRPEREFTHIMQMGQLGKTGETYAFDRTGLLVSNSRFDEKLMLVGLLPDHETAQSILTISLRDPGGNLFDGYRPQIRRAKLPLTAAAASAVAGNSGVDLTGARDYRGVPVVCAWTWLSKYEMGIMTAIDYAEAFRPLTILRRAFFTLFGLLVLSSVAIFLFTLSVARLQREARKAAIEAKQLGQYQLEERLGSGAMGVVYKGQHAMLRRPTAIKLLSADRVDDSSIARFEQEVQITCKLNHPSTIAIYDYGRTPEGVFYYAMEFLDGINLQTLVEKYGPLPEGRVIAVLRQMCGSLYEAHSLGLVHRDIKPANVMLNRRGGEADVVKVLDFGLVKALNDEKQMKASHGMSGTPLYMSPEAITSPNLVDARSDLYAVGAVGYFLLTGEAMFKAASVVELCQMHVTALPDLPSNKLGRGVTPELEHAIMACLEKNPSKRPQTARALSVMLDRAATAHSWTADEAEAWWSRHERAEIAAVAKSHETPTLAADHAASTTGKKPTGNDGKATSPGFDRTQIFEAPEDAE